MRIFGNIKNLIRWFSVIWNDRDWDHYFFYVILRTKLIHMEKFFRKYGHHVLADKDADNMKTAISLLDRLMKDDYLDNALKEHHKKWGRIYFKFLDDNSTEFVYDKAKVGEDLKKADKEFKRASDHSEYMIERDLDLLFKILRKNIRRWWD